MAWPGYYFFELFAGGADGAGCESAWTALGGATVTVTDGSFAFNL